MIQCPVCRVTYVANTVFCVECGFYLLGDEEIGTDPLETTDVDWQEETDVSLYRDMDLPDTGLLTIRLRIVTHKTPAEKGDHTRELEISLVKPIRIGRIDPMQDIYPDIDLTEDLAVEYGVSRMHACIFRKGKAVAVEDLGSTNGTLLNGKRLAPYIPELLKDGDQIQLGKLLIEVSFVARN